jgi:hypothetical protein
MGIDLTTLVFALTTTMISTINMEVSQRPERMITKFPHFLPIERRRAISIMSSKWIAMDVKIMIRHYF